MPEIANVNEKELTDNSPDHQAEAFQNDVRTALTHLYDNAFLQSHPLTLLLASSAPGDRLTQAQALRRLLLDCIERLRPQPTAPSDAARAYAVLTYRCVDGLTIEEIERKLGLSRRQTYREWTKGIEAIASQLQDLLQTAPPRSAPAAPLPPTRQELAEAELARLSQEARCEALDLNELLQGVRHLLGSRLQRRKIDMTVSELSTALPLLADRTLLRQALLNLLSHALDVLPAGSCLTIESTEEAGSLQILLRQTSHPQPMAAPPTPLREGVALTVAQSLIGAQNGRLTLHERPDLWSAEIVLPTAQAPTVLIVDDNQTLVDLFQRYLAGHRIVVAGVYRGDGVLEAVRQLHPQLILLDVMMPHQDGWEVLQGLRQAGVAVPILVCSVLREHELALALGANDTLVKPVSQPVLLDALRRWLGTLSPLDGSHSTPFRSA